MDDEELVDALHRAADVVAGTLDSISDWGLTGDRSGQHHSDLAADAAAIEVLEAAGLGIVSEESGRHHPDRPVTVVLDPLDGSTNAARRLSWYGISLCALDGAGPRAALVVDLAHEVRFEAVRDRGARRDRKPIAPSGATRLRDSLLAVNGLPSRHLGWAQFRALGAAALDLCAVACGQVDAYLDCTSEGHGPWDYLGGLMVCVEAGASVRDVYDRDLLVVDHEERRAPLAAATDALADEVQRARLATPEG